MTTAFIVLNLVLSVFVLAAILGIAVGGLIAARREEIAAEAHTRSPRRRAQPRPAEQREIGRRSGRAVAA